MREFITSLSIWSYHEQEYPIVITTNGIIKKDGTAVMGKGIALEAAKRFPDLPLKLAQHLKANGNIPGWFPRENLFTFPTKYHFMEASDFDLIRNSAVVLQRLYAPIKQWPKDRCYLPQVGCGNGGLTWMKVYPIITPILSDDFIALIHPDDSNNYMIERK